MYSVIFEYFFPANIFPPLASITEEEIYRKSNDEHIIILRSLIMSYIILPIKIVNDAAKNDYFIYLIFVYFYYRKKPLTSVSKEFCIFFLFKTMTSVVSIKKMLSKHYKFTAIGDPY